MVKQLRRSRRIKDRLEKSQNTSPSTQNCIPKKKRNSRKKLKSTKMNVIDLTGESPQETVVHPSTPKKQRKKIQEVKKKTQQKKKSQKRKASRKSSGEPPKKKKKLQAKIVAKLRKSPKKKNKFKKDVLISTVALPEDPDLEEKIRYVLHPVNVYKTLHEKLPVYRMKCFEKNTKMKTMEQMNSKWKKLKMRKLKRREDLVEGCMLSYLDLLPSRETVPNYVTASYKTDNAERILEYLDPSIQSPIIQYLKENPNHKSFLCLLLCQGVYFSQSGFNQQQIDVCLQVHNQFYKYLNEKMLKSYGIEDVRNSNGIPFREFLFRGEPKDDIDCKTLDISLMLGAVECPFVSNYILSLDIIQHVQNLYASIHPDQELRLVNCGFFQSPSGNEGQNWHTDESVNYVNQTHIQLPKLFTLVVAVTDQSVDDYGSTGSTVFAVGSHIPVHTVPSLFPKGYDIISPVLKKGDVALFAGNLFHRGGAFSNISNTNQRILLYGVFHLLSKSQPQDALLKTDKNITEIKQLFSFFGGKRLTMKVDENNQVHIERARRSLRRNKS